MKTLQSQRAHYLKCTEAAGNAEVWEVVQSLEKQLPSISKEDCKKAWAETYVRTGSFSPTPWTCVTKWTVECSDKNLARTKEFFEQRNPEASVECHAASEDERAGWCRATIKPESFFQ